AGRRLCGKGRATTPTPRGGGLAWTGKLARGACVGAPVLRRQKSEGVTRRLVAFTLQDRAIARHGYPIREDGAPIGRVTSGSYGPTVENSIGLGFVPLEYAELGRRLEVEIRGRGVPAVVTKLPFYTRPAAGGA